MSLQPFPRPAGEVGLGAFSAEGPPITVQDLVQLDVRVTWDEAVSIVEELCVAAQGLVMRPVPAAKDIILNAGGTVALRHSSPGVPDPIEAARRLHELLSGVVAPAPLRLFVSQAVSSGSYTSLSEFQDALAYYAKPGRQDRVRAVYQRASDQQMSRPQAQAVIDVPHAIAMPAVVPELAPASQPHPVAIPTVVPEPGQSWRSHPSWHSWRQLATLGLAAAAAATAVVGFGLYFWTTGSSRSAATVAPAAEDAAVPSGDGDGVPTSTDTVPPAGARGAGRAAARVPGSALDVVSIPLTGSRAVRLPGSGGTRRAPGTASSPVPGLPPLRSPAVSPVPAAEPRGDGPRLQPQARTPQAQAPQAIAREQEITVVPTEWQPLYSASDASVQPAVLVKPQLLPPPFANGGSSRPVRMELIISMDGTVERARFLEAPQRMADMMLLSSAKTWLFTPAVKDGLPVRYRTVVTWVGAP